MNEEIIHQIESLNEITQGWSDGSELEELDTHKIQYLNTRPTHSGRLMDIEKGVYFTTNKEGHDVWVLVGTNKDIDNENFSMKIVQNVETEEFMFMSPSRKVYTNIYLYYPEYPDETHRIMDYRMVTDLQRRAGIELECTTERD